MSRKTLRFTDIHSHLLPGTDDGARDIEEAVRLLRAAAEAGVSGSVLTPHFREEDHTPGSDIISSRFAEIKERMQKELPGLFLALGQEIYYSRRVLSLLESGSILTMNGTRFVLVEFSSAERFVDMRNGLNELICAGYKPVLAHAERYECLLDDMGHGRELKAMGVFIQLNAASLTRGAGHRRSALSVSLLKEGLVDYISSDVHRHEERILALKKSGAYLYRRLDEGYVDSILYGNANRDILSQWEKPLPL